MTNAITKKEFDKIKNNTSFSVVSFENNKRVHTYTGLTITEIMKRQVYDYDCLLIRNLPDMEVSYNKEDYLKYL